MQFDQNSWSCQVSLMLLLIIPTKERREEREKRDVRSGHEREREREASGVEDQHNFF